MQHRKHYMDFYPVERRRSNFVIAAACLACFAMIGILLGLGG